MVDDDIANEQSLSLADTLQKYDLVAKSFWQYYESDWTSVQWKTAVQFFHERRGEDDEDGSGDDDGARILDERPYHALLPPASQNNAFLLMVEHPPSESVVHRYPRLLALGTLLFEIGRETRQKNPATASQSTKMEAKTLEERINTDLNNIRRALRRGHSRALAVEERRAIVDRRVVYPLKLLLERLGWVDGSGNVQWQDEGKRSHDARGHDTKASFLSTGDAADQVQIRNQPSLPRIRIAVLGTGYDPASAFFTDGARRRRIQKWKDLTTENGQNARDEDGHGTYVLSLLMEVIPTADIYVARVARNASELADSTSNIALEAAFPSLSAIEWASKEHRVDIISMPFGFEREVPDADGNLAITNALSEALHTKNQEILFFAAGANEGGNRAKMFPASHPHVISIRGTDYKGWLQRYNTPRAHLGSGDCFMTLGQDVPGAGLSANNDSKGEVEVCRSSTSVSTPIAAGRAGILLGYARLFADDVQKYLGDRRDGIMAGNRAPGLATVEGMRKMLMRMSREMMDGYCYLAAEAFLQLNTHESRIGALGGSLYDK
ncbi:peptidase S8/S53, subtilisin/kexin/sedolisin [Lasiosphaeria ovina]|uniref:Peptidase S8/S53, subtilisin/kexin/sedolisin n=1 Tax=Lasiosphaeria ovina TaxID=92902 RepID=A0AAE0JYJ7_9PEZI|nr:peptidase S8/S53, subtilisin/kexin/sedolisin [Lasiosphaeria ovina]